MSKSVKSNLSYRKKGRRLFNKEIVKTTTDQKIQIENKLSKEELIQFSKKFQKEHNRYNRKILIITLILSLFIIGAIAYLMNI